MTTPNRQPSSRGSTPTNSSLNGVGRPSPSRGSLATPRSAFGGARRPPMHSTISKGSNEYVSATASEEDARAENLSLMEELKERLRNTESAAEEYQRQLNMSHTKLDESLQEQEKLEDQMHENNKRVEELQNDKIQILRQKREMESVVGSERSAFSQERTEQRIKEEELQSVIHRLKETLANRDSQNTVDGGKEERRASQDFAPPSWLQSDSNGNSKVISQRDKTIESLQLELAEAQIKLMEVENMGGSRVHELEQSLLETRITNARLMEDNESFQLLLSEKTMNGDFSKADVLKPPPSGLGSLAEELESAEGESENYRRLEVEAKAIKDQNRALTLYIENIIGRLLQHSEFEDILDKTPDLMSGKPPEPVDTNKDLPPPPPPKDTPKEQHDEEAPSSLLQRARSVVGGSARRPRPVSQMPPQPPAPPTVNEDPSKAPRIPLGRSQSVRNSSIAAHRRSQSDMPQGPPLVNQMYRGPPSNGSGGPLGSPGVTSITSNRASFFAPGVQQNPHPAPRASSGSRSRNENANPGSGSNSTFSERSGDAASGASPPRNRSGETNYTGAIMTQSKLRPLRLVQENQEMDGGSRAGGGVDDVAAQKRANRNSWMPQWFQKGKEDELPGR